MIRDRRGFTFIELLVVIMVISLLTGLALPKYQQIRKRGTAAEAIAAIGVVRHAAFAYNESTGQWAPGGSTGQTPAELTAYLPDGFSFSQPDFDLAWRHATWLSAGVEQSAQMVQVYTHDPYVCDAVNHLLGGAGNPDLLASCDGQTGIVTLYVDT
jgi:prepilin-type N-terminal cleavage/methylation domain-containing protein